MPFLSQFWKRSAPIQFSWILPSRLAIGPAPLTAADWKILESAGFQSRFSCCYPGEVPLQPGSEAAFLHGGVSLPDHRQQEPLSRERLLQAINASREMLDHSPPLYLHCLAGRERSVALAIAHVSMIRGLSVYEALLAVRAAHPPANPLFEHLELLEVLLKPEQPFSLATEPSLQSIQPPGAA